MSKDIDLGKLSELKERKTGGSVPIGIGVGILKPTEDNPNGQAMALFAVVIDIPGIALATMPMDPAEAQAFLEEAQNVLEQVIALRKAAGETEPAKPMPQLDGFVVPKGGHA